MRLSILIAAAALAVAAFQAIGTPAKADPYRWCANYGARGVSNCYFMTYGQCRAAISGNGGFCVLNNFYDGLPVITPDDVIRRRYR
jgi:hypothetical protein